jgi:hypothetical protein
MQFLRKTQDLNYIYPKKKKKLKITIQTNSSISQQLFFRSLEEKSL